MKKLMIAIACFAFVLALTPAASARMAGQGIWRANIPYGFQVENQKFPAGTYQVTVDAGRLILVSEDGQDRLNALTIRTEARETPEKSTLTFVNYNGYHFLRSIQVAGHEAGRELLKSKFEVELARKGAAGTTQVVAMK